MPDPRRFGVGDAGAAGAAWRTEGATAVLVLSGDWAMAQPTPRVDEVVGAGSGPVTFDAGALGHWDSSLLLFLLGLQQACVQQQRRWDPAGLPPQVPRLLALAQAGSAVAPPAPAPPITAVARLGTSAIAWWDELVAGIRFSGDVALALSGMVTRRVHMRWREFGVALQMNTSGALPIVTLIALLVGVIIAFLGVVVLKRFGAGYYVSYLSGFGMLREMGALMTGIIMAGRTGAAYAAEIGSMKLNEEIDAYTTLGISPVEHLVLPRMLGVFVAMPLLTLYADVVGIVGGMVVSASLLDLSSRQFVGGLLDAVTLSDALLGLAKGTVFGLIIGGAGCLQGLQAGTNAGAVGRAATKAVVLGITLIITANAVFDWLAALLDI